MIVLGSKGGVLGSNRPWIRYNVIRSRNVPAMGWYFSSRVLSRRPHFQWSEPQNFGTILFIINSNINSETPYFATLEKTLPKRMVFNMSSLKSPPIAVIPCRARKWTSIFNVLKVPLSGSLGLSICFCLSHTRHTVVPTHHSILSVSPLMLPRPRSRPSMISSSLLFNHSRVVTWISVGSPTADITHSSYPMPTSLTTYVHSNIKTSPTIVIRRSISTSISPTMATSLPTPK